MASAGSQSVDSAGAVMSSTPCRSIAVWVLSTATNAVLIQVVGIHDANEWVTLDPAGVSGLEFTHDYGQIAALKAKCAAAGQSETVYWSVTRRG